MFILKKNQKTTKKHAKLKSQKSDFYATLILQTLIFASGAIGGKNKNRQNMRQQCTVSNSVSHNKQ